MNTQQKPSANHDEADLVAFRHSMERKAGHRITSGVLAELPKKNTKKKRCILFIGIPAALIVLVGCMYLLFVFSSIPFFTHWRTIYIETAMSTGHHHWLAESFIPADIVKEVMDNKAEQDRKNQDAIGGSSALIGADDTNDTDKEDEPIRKNNDILGQRDLTVGDTDYAGYKVEINDLEECLVVSKIVGSNFNGKIMLIDDPARVYVGTTPDDMKGIEGLRIKDMMNYYDAVAGINASGFNDPNENGLGGEPVGMCAYGGQFWGSYVPYYGSIVLTTTNMLAVGNIDIWENYNIRDGVQFGPVLIADGVPQVSGSAGYGIHPRTAIGQRADGVIVFLVIDGRSVTSAGCTVGDLVDILMKYEVINAACCDGGASSLIAYNGEIITKNSSLNPSYGRLLPNAFLVRHKDKN